MHHDTFRTDLRYLQLSVCTFPKAFYFILWRASFPYVVFMNGCCQAEDPFWEPSDLDVVIGVASLPLKFLSYMIEFKEDPLTILDYTAQSCGFLEVQLIPCDKAGKEGSDFAVDDPSDLVNITVFSVLLS